MADVLEFTKPTPAPVETDFVWECPCGNTEFFLHQSGYVECGSCGEISNKMGCFIWDDAV